MDRYPYNDAWKSGVDHNGEEWRAYCEAVSTLRHYFATKTFHGKHQAVLEFKATCARKEEKLGARGKVLADRLRADFLLVGRYEGDRIEYEALSQAA
jgi:hypothetical protein